MLAISLFCLVFACSGIFNASVAELSGHDNDGSLVSDNNEIDGVDVSPFSSEDAQLPPSTVTVNDKWKQGKDLTLPPSSFNDDVDLGILDSDYFDDPKTKPSTTTYFQQEENLEEVEEPLVQVQKAPCLGCPVQSDLDSPKIQDVALFAFGEYAKGLGEGQGGQQAQQFVRVTKAETQVVAGIKYILEVEIGWSNCSNQDFNENPEDCQLDPTKDTFRCDFHVVEKSWENTKEVVNAKCHKDDVETKVSDQGGVLDYDPSLLDDNIESSSIERTTETPATGVFEETRRKRDTSSKFASIRDADEEKEVLDELAKFAVQQLDSADDDNNARLLVDVLKARKQTVAGRLYHLQIRVVQTTCTEGEDNSLEKCKDKFILPFAICDVKILVQPWQTVQRKLTQSQCRQEEYKKSKKLAKQLFRRQFSNQIVKLTAEDTGNKVLIGGAKTVDPDSPEILELTTFAIDSLDQASNALHAQKLVRVVSAKRQLVAGIRTTVVLEIGYTTCRKHQTLDKSKCDIDEKREHQFCSLTIVEKPWLQEKKLVESKCGKRNLNVPSIKKKRDSGAETPEEIIVPDDSESDEEVDPLVEDFRNFVAKHNKVYATEEERQYRLGVFKENMRKVKLLQEHEQGTATYGATHFADLTDEEFTSRHLGLRTDLRQRMKRKQAKIPVLARIPDEFDWRHYNAVTPVKNQGSCGSCWAFSVSGNIEGAYALKHGNLESFSEQELVDCDTLDEGCNGGLPENADKILQKMGGLETEKEYPYEGRDEKCHFSPKLAKAKVSGFVEVSKNETEMAAWLLKNGPISIGINAAAMQFYFGGVSHPWKFLCSPKNLDHGVLIVGYGVHTTSIRHKVMPYWIVKNSWGPGWGEKGYYRVYRGDGTCGVNQMATSALVV